MSDRCEPSPEHRDRDGWHWLDAQFPADPPFQQAYPWFWKAAQGWWSEPMARTPEEVAQLGWRYLGPVAPLGLMTEKPQTVAHGPRFDALLWEAVVEDIGTHGGYLDRIARYGGSRIRHNRPANPQQSYIVANPVLPDPRFNPHLGRDRRASRRPG